MNKNLWTKHNKKGGKNMSKQFKPGEQAPKSANYSCYDKDGRCGGSCYLEKGQRFPATQHSGSHYEMDEE